MFRQLRIAIRMLSKHKSITAINVFGLTIGVLVTIFIMLFTSQELSYDQYHNDSDRIFRLTTKFVEGGKTLHYAGSSSGASENLLSYFTDIEDVARAYPAGSYLVTIDENSFEEKNVMFADPQLFNILTFGVEKGNPERALKDPYSVVLTKTTAARYFGDQDPINMVLEIDLGEASKTKFRVASVIDDLPVNSSLDFGLILPYRFIDQLNDNSSESLYLLKLSSEHWEGGLVQVFVKLREGVSQPTLEKQFPIYIERFRPEFSKPMELVLQPLQEIYFSSPLLHDPVKHGDERYLKLLIAIALLVLSITTINYINMATAQYSARGREIGLKRILGAGRLGIGLQILKETFVSVFASILLAIILAYLLIPSINGMAEAVLTRNNLLLPSFIGYLFIAGIVLSLIAGIYPAFFLSGLEPIRTLKGGTKSRSDNRFRKALVLVQFIMTCFLIIGVVVIQRQLQFINTKSLGFDKENVILLSIWDNSTAEQYERYRQAFLNTSGVVSVSTGTCYPGDTYFRGTFLPEDRKENDHVKIFINPIDYHYFESLKIDMVEGRNFSTGSPVDISSNFIINESAAKMLGWEKDAIGKSIAWRRIVPNDQKNYYNFREGDIIGIVKDYNFKSLHTQIDPIIFIIHQPWYTQFAIRIESNNVPGVIENLEKSWRSMGNIMPFDYRFLDTNIDVHYAKDKNLANLVYLFTIIGTILASIGLFGLSEFTIVVKLKEFGIRKVLGISTSELFKMFVRTFIYIVIIAMIVAIPVGYVVMNNWLEGFAYRVDLSWEIFFLSGFLAIAICFATVLYHTFKLAKSNPVDILRVE